MPLDHDRIVNAVAARLAEATTVPAACHAIVDTLTRYAPARISVLLWARDRLRCVAAGGAWQVFATVPPGAGIATRVYNAGKTEAVAPVSSDPDYLPLRPDVTAEVCTPILDRAGRPVGVLDLEWTGTVDLGPWRDTAERTASHLGDRIGALGGPPGESGDEKLLRHAVALATVATEWALKSAVIDAARDVSGLDVAVLVFSRPQGRHDGTPTVLDSQARHDGVPTVVPDVLESRIRAALSAAGEPALERLLSRAHRFGSSYTLGEPGHLAIADYQPLVSAGAGTVIAIPVGPVDTGGLLLAADGRVLRPEPATVGLLELLAAHAWTCLDRLRTLAHLREQAISDPLTGLRNQGNFGTRIASATPGRTALLAIDVDDFKIVNDTYGHQAGDQVLVGIARALEKALRQGDELYRIGGDEFVAVVEVGRPEEAVGIAERLVEAARRTGRTISVGVALQHAGESAELTLRRADAALYDVKREGRDGVRLAVA